MPKLPAPTSDVFVLPLSEAEIFYVAGAHQIVSRIRVSSPSSAEERLVRKQPGSEAADPSARNQRDINP